MQGLGDAAQGFAESLGHHPVIRAAIYCRLSKNRKGSKSNVKDQERNCREFVEAQGWQLVDVYVDDGIGASDKTTRPRVAFPNLMRDVRAGLINVIVATEFTRLYRRPRELEELLDPIDKFHYDVDLVTIEPTVRWWDIRTGVGRAQLREAAKQAAEYSDYIAEKVRSKFRSRARDGRWHSGHPGFGFDYVPAVRDNEGNVIEEEKITIDEPQAAVIREVVQRIVGGHKTRPILNDLNRRGIRSRNGKLWTYSNLQKVLAKPAIAGLVRYGDDFIKTDRWPAIVSEADWRELQKILTDPHRRTNFIGTRTALLTGFLYCGYPDCGRPLAAGRDNRGKRVYICRPESARGCGRIKRLAEPIEQLITELIISILEDSEFMVPLDTGDEFAALEGQKREVKNGLQQLALDHYRLHLISREEFLTTHDALEADLAAIQRRLDRATTNRHVKELPVGEVAQEEWDAHADDLAWRRELIQIVLGGRKIIVKPSRYGRRPPPFHPHFGAAFDPEDIDITPPIAQQGHGVEAQ
jgi:site-specific DNA recombinase